MPVQDSRREPPGQCSFSDIAAGLAGRSVVW